MPGLPTFQKTLEWKSGEFLFLLLLSLFIRGVGGILHRVIRNNLKLAYLLPKKKKHMVVGKTACITEKEYIFLHTEITVWQNVRPLYDFGQDRRNLYSPRLLGMIWRRPICKIKHLMVGSGMIVFSIKNTVHICILMRVDYLNLCYENTL